MFDFENEEESKCSVNPRAAIEILGISEWDGRGRSTSYRNGFLFVTHTGSTYYLSVKTKEIRNEWMCHVRRALESTFANHKVVPFKPTKILQSRPMGIISPRVCAKTGQNIVSGTTCKACNRLFSSPELVQDSATMLQIGSEVAERCCCLCKNAQLCIYWLKTLNYVHLLSLHELSVDIAADLGRLKSTFYLRRISSGRLNDAFDLFERSHIPLTELEAICLAEHQEAVENVDRAATEMQLSLDELGCDVTALIQLFLSQSSEIDAMESSSVSCDFSTYRTRYFQLVVKLLQIAEMEPELIDFYLPQLMQVHLLQSLRRSPLSLVQLDLLQQGLLVIAQRFPAVSLKMLWLILASFDDYYNGNQRTVCQVQFASCVCFLVQLEMVVTGTVSVLADVPSSILLSKVLEGSSHQQQELAFDLTTLFLIRRQLQEECEKESVRISRSEIVRHSNSGSNKCVDMFFQLGVGSSSPADDAGEVQPISSQIRLMQMQVSKIVLSHQVDFIDRLTKLVDSLRDVSRSLRTETFCKEIATWNENPEQLGWDPCCVAGEPTYRITRIFPNECRVFRTKARAPTMVVCEVQRQDICDSVQLSLTDQTKVPLDSVDDIQTAEPRSLHSGRRRRTMSIDDRSEVVADSTYPDSLHHIGVVSKLDVFGKVDTLIDGVISQAIADMNKAKDASLRIDPLLSSADCMAEAVEEEEIDSDLRSDIQSLDYADQSRPFDVRLSDPVEGGNESLPLTSPQASIDSTAGGSESAVGERRPSILSGKFKTKPLAVPLVAAAAMALSTPTRTSVSRLSTDFTPQSLVLAKAHRLLSENKIDETEYDLLVKSEVRCFHESSRLDEEITKVRVSAFFGETWESKKKRILGDKYEEGCDGAENGRWPRWDLRCFIVKSNDDLRQEVCCLQLMHVCREIFEDCGLKDILWLKPYRIVSTGSSTGVVEVLKNAISLDALKKTPGFTSLSSYFKKTYGSTEESLLLARRNFCNSLAAYSLFTHLLLIKDRHNGNILIDTEGHLMHIDFGFMLSIAPGGNFSLESAPFKLTEDMVDVIGGFESPLFVDFIRAFTNGFLALRSNAHCIINTLQVIAIDSPFPCFASKDSGAVLGRLRSRFRLDLTVQEAVNHCSSLIVQSYGHYGTKQYDSFQWYTNGIHV